MSTAMLQHRRDLVEWDIARPNHYSSPGGDIIVLFSEQDESGFCSGVFPRIFEDQFCNFLFFVGSGIYSKPIILCPEADLGVCVHEIAHAVYYAANRTHSGGTPDPSRNERQPVIDRFAEPDVADLWSGYAMESHWEFFAEMSTIYFCVPGGSLTLPVKHCASELREYDPATYEVIHAIYRGSTDLRPLR